MFARYNSISSFRHDKRKPKRKRVHVPHSKRPKEFVDHRNSKERQRVGEMADAFDALTSVLPKSDDNVKPARVDILRGAIDYIHELESKLIDENKYMIGESNNRKLETQDRVWIDNTFKATASVNVTGLEGQITHDRKFFTDYSEVSSSEHGSVYCAVEPLEYAFPSTGDTIWNDSMHSLESPPSSNLEFPPIPEEQSVHELEPFRGLSQDHYSHMDMVYESSVCTFSEIHMNSSNLETRQRLVDITNTVCNTRGYHNSCTYGPACEISKPMVSDLSSFDVHYPGQERGMGVYCGPSGPSHQNNSTGFYSIF